MNVTDYLNRVEKDLVKYLEKQAQLAPSKEAKLLLGRIKQISSIGKRFRPALFFTTYQAYGGQEKVISIGLAIELIHQGLLIHDDLIDQDIIRHGRLNIVGLYQKDNLSEELSKAMGLIAGDLAFELANNIILFDTNLSSNLKLQVLKLINQQLKITIFGEQLDSMNINNQLTNFKTKTLNQIYLLKTASYTTELPMLIAATLVNLPKPEVTKITKFAQHLGIYYQLLNDYDDYFKVTKSSYQLKDFQAGKLTYPLLVARQLMNKRSLRRVDRLFSKPRLSFNQKLLLVDLLITSGAQRATEDLINNYLLKATAELNKFNISQESKNKLLDLVNRLKL